MATPVSSGTPPRRPLTIAVLNDFHVVIEGIRGMLAPWASSLRIVEANVRSPLRQGGVDIVLYDTFGQEARELQRVRQQLHGARVGHLVVYTWKVTPESAQVLLQQGVSGVISKRASASGLANALMRIARGEQVVLAGPDRRPAVQELPGWWPGRSARLAPREAEMLALICQGMTNEQISRHTGLGVNTIKSYNRSAYRKIGVTRRADAVRWAYEHHLNPDAPGARVFGSLDELDAAPGQEPAPGQDAACDIT